jgi:hypothetical protein
MNPEQLVISRRHHGQVIPAELLPATPAIEQPRADQAVIFHRGTISRAMQGW